MDMKLWAKFGDRSCMGSWTSSEEKEEEERKKNQESMF